MLTYPIVVEADGDGFLITCPDLPEVTTDADHEDDAPERARDAIEESLAGRLAAFEDIPRPSEGAAQSAEVDPYISTKVALFWAMKDAQQTRAGLMRELGWKRTSVDRLFHARHATRLDQFSAAFKALGKRMDITAD